MAQYKVGTVTVTNGSATVTGSGTAWVASVPVGSYFVVAGDVVAYQVASRTNTQITLTAPYGGSSGSGRSYVAHVDFHSNGAPSFLDDDIESAAILNRWLVQSWPAAAFGTAATRNVMTSLTDTTTPDALMPRGAFGLGLANSISFLEGNIADIPTSMPFRGGSNSFLPAERPISTNAVNFLGYVVKGFQNAQFTIMGHRDLDRLWFERRPVTGEFQGWQELYHTGNTGTAVTHDVTTSATDTTANRLLKVGDFGVGSLTGNLTSDFSTLFTGPAQISRNAAFRTCLTMKYDASRGTQLELDISGVRAFIRGLGTAGGTPVTSELYHTGNLGESDTAWTTVTSLQNGWTGRVRYIKRGGIVVINADQLNGASATSSTILSISSSYTPSVDQYAISIEGSSGASRRVTASGLGIIVLSGDRSTIADSAFRITYPTLP